MNQHRRKQHDHFNIQGQMEINFIELATFFHDGTKN